MLRSMVGKIMKKKNSLLLIDFCHSKTSPSKKKKIIFSHSSVDAFTPYMDTHRVHTLLPFSSSISSQVNLAATKILS